MPLPVFGCKLADALPACPNVTSNCAGKPGVGLNIRGKVSFKGKQSISRGRRLFQQSQWDISMKLQNEKCCLLYGYLARSVVTPASDII